MNGQKYDISIIRPQMRADDVRLRPVASSVESREAIAPEKLKAIKKRFWPFVPSK